MIRLVRHAAAEVLGWLSSRPPEVLDPLQIILWWEVRRIPYNVIVGASGSMSLCVFYLLLRASGEVTSGEDAFEPLVLLMSPVVINICYTLGWMVEIPIDSVLQDTKAVGPALYKFGTLFSIVVVWSPAVVTGLTSFFQFLLKSQ